MFQVLGCSIKFKNAILCLNVSIMRRRQIRSFRQADSVGLIFIAPMIHDPEKLLFPLSGALELYASAQRKDRPMISHKIPYSRLMRHMDGDTYFLVVIMLSSSISVIDC